jgi:hypothetical protein
VGNMLDGMGGIKKEQLILAPHHLQSKEILPLMKMATVRNTITVRRNIAKHYYKGPKKKKGPKKGKGKPKKGAVVLYIASITF